MRSEILQRETNGWQMPVLAWHGMGAWGWELAIEPYAVRQKDRQRDSERQREIAEEIAFFISISISISLPFPYFP